MSSLSLLTNDIILVIGGTVKHKFKKFLKNFLAAAAWPLRVHYFTVYKNKQVFLCIN